MSYGVTLVQERLCLVLSWQYPVLSPFYYFHLWYRIQQVSAHIQSLLLTVSWHTVSMASRCTSRLPFLHILLYRELVALKRNLEGLERWLSG